MFGEAQASACIIVYVVCVILQQWAVGIDLHNLAR